MNRCTYLFLDEGGNFDFSNKGSPYFILTSIAVQRPFALHVLLDDFKHDCLEFGLNMEFFHCSDDNSHVRKRVFNLIAKRLDFIRIDCLVIEKQKTAIELREDKRFYPEMLGQLLKFVIPRELNKDIDEVIVITDTLPVQRKRQAIEKAIQHALALMLPSGMRYRILHHASRSHFGLQIADYCNWAIFRKWQKNDFEFYSQIKPAICSEFEMFENKE